MRVFTFVRIQVMQTMVGTNQEFEAQKVIHSFLPLKNELLKNIRTQVLRLFDDPEKIQSLLTIDISTRAKEIKKLFDAATAAE